MLWFYCQRCGEIFGSESEEELCEPCRAMKAKSAKYSKAVQRFLDKAKITVTCADCGKTFQSRAKIPGDYCYLCRRKRAVEKQKEYRRQERRERLATAEHKPPAEKIFLCNVCLCEFKAPASSHPKYCKDYREAARRTRAAGSRQARSERAKSREAPQEQISDIMAKAAAEGLTYGQYMAKYR
jgi:predicted  nucleic acid-binding Zn-ribbon protein